MFHYYRFPPSASYGVSKGPVLLSSKIDPHDEKFRKELLEFLSEEGVPFKVKNEYLALPTASRSQIIIDPKTGESFSLKTSTDKIRAERSQYETDRPLRGRHAYFNRRLSDYFRSQAGHLKNLGIAGEVASISLHRRLGASRKIDLAQMAREMESVSRGKNYQYSVFALSDERELKRILQASGMSRAEFTEAVSRNTGAAVLGLENSQINDHLSS